MCTFLVVLAVWMWLAGAVLYASFVISVSSMEKKMMGVNRVTRTLFLLLWPLYMLAHTLIGSILTIKERKNETQKRV